MLAQLTIDKEEIQGFYYSNISTIGAVTGRKRTFITVSMALVSIRIWIANS